MKNIWMVFFSLMTVSISVGQINEEIKKYSQDNQNKKNNNNEGSSLSSGTDTYSSSDSGSDIIEGCVDACTSECAGMFIDALGAFFVGIGELNIDYAKSREDKVPYIMSVDIGMQIGFLPNQYLILLPQIHGQAGIFSTDFRVYHNREYRFQEIDPYTTWDWQILQFNLVSLPKVNFKIGSGLMFENIGTTTSSFNEHSAVTNVYLLDRFRLNVEGRFTTDYQTGVYVRQEVNSKIMYQLNQNENFKWNLVAGGLWARYYQAVDVWTVSLGTSITFQ